jgi:hypothetical protein
VSAPRFASVTGFVFSAADVAWAFGSVGEQNIPLLLRSGDAGRSWENVTFRLPPECDGIVDLAFVDEAVAYVVARGVFRPRRVFTTSDAGEHWSEVPAFASGALPTSSYALEARGAAVELVRADDGFSVARMDDLAVPPVLFAPSGGGFFSGPNGFSVVGLRGWIAATFYLGSTFPIYRTTILASAAPGAEWVEQPLALAGQPELRAIDVRDPRDGVAGGYVFVANEVGALVPFLFVLGTDGETWERAAIADAPDGFTIVDVLRLRGDVAWAVATDITSGAARSVMLRSDDGGRSWRRAPTAFEDGFQFSDLARNTAGR